ncbi:MAG TPA: hypothetical protein ACFYD1_00105 [Candidatus Hypogeohydataceae bacterium YC38]|nr:hypothetical protein [Candidatus Brocadiales bacterium]
MTRESSLWPWLLQRLSGIFLSLGVLIHFWMLHSRGGPPTYNEMVTRLGSPGWISFYLFLLAVLIYHGLNGFWAIFLDFDTSTSSKAVFKLVLYIIGLGTFATGALILGWKP